MGWLHFGFHSALVSHVSALFIEFHPFPASQFASLESWEIVHCPGHMPVRRETSTSTAKLNTVSPNASFLRWTCSNTKFGNLKTSKFGLSEHHIYLQARIRFNWLKLHDSEKPVTFDRCEHLTANCSFNEVQLRMLILTSPRQPH